jgi:hypothetical protein
MAEPFDSAVTLQTVANALYELYHEDLLEDLHMTGSATNRLIKPMDKAIQGDGLNIKCKRYGGDHSRIGNDALADFQASTPYGIETYKVRWDERDPTTHDFTRVDFTGRTSIYQFDDADSAGAIVDVVDEIEGDIKSDAQWTMAALRRIPRSGLVGYINGTPVQNDALFVANGTALGTPTHMRCRVDNTAIPLFRPGKFYDVYDGATLKLANIRCTQVNEADTTSASAGSVAFEIVTTGAKQSSAATFATSNVADNYAFYIAGSKGKCMYSCEAWYTLPSTGEAFIGGKDRSQAAYQWMTPNLLRTGETATKISKDHLRAAGNVLANVTDKQDMSFVAVGNDLLIDALRDQYEAAAWVTYPEGDSRTKRFANLGSIGVNYQHPSLGLLKIVADQFMVPDHLDLMNMESWKQCYRGSKGIRYLPGEIGPWYRMQGAVAGAGKGLMYALDAYMNLVDVNFAPKTNVRIANLKAV